MKNNMKTVGIIGGLGPETTAKFQLELINFCSKNNKVQRPPFLMWNVPVVIKVEEDLIINNGYGKGFLALLIDGARILEKAGADFLVMPCNTLHIFIEEIRKSVNIPVLSIIDGTIVTLKKQKIKKIGLLATSKTISENLFGKLEENRIKQTIPNKKDQLALDKIIHRLVLGKQNKKDKVKANLIIKKMARQGTRDFLLACTDLQLIIKDHPQIRILDTMQILAKATANEILKGGDKNDKRK